MQIWIPRLNAVYAFLMNNKIHYIRFHKYGVSSSSTHKPLQFSFGVYADDKCQQRLFSDYDNRNNFNVFDFVYTEVGYIETLVSAKPLPKDMAKILKFLCAKSNQSRLSVPKIQFAANINVNEHLAAQYSARVMQNDDGTFRYEENSKSRFLYAEPVIYVESFTPDDVVYLYCRLRNQTILYDNGWVE